jgi:hypothetical protein
MAAVCAPCISSIIGPTALGALGLSTLNKTKKKKTKKKKTKKKEKKSSKNGGSGYESQEEYNLMNNYINEETREEEMKKECSDFMKFVIKHKNEKEQKDYANKSFEHKVKCLDGDIKSCDYCKGEYIKLLLEQEKEDFKNRTKKSKKSKKSKSKSKSKGGARSKSKSKSKRKRSPPPVPREALPQNTTEYLFDPTTTERNKLLLESTKSRMNKRKSKTKKNSQRLSKSLKSKGRKRTPLRGRLRMYQVPKPGQTPDDNEIKDLEKSMELLEKDRRFRDIFDTFAYAEGIPVETDEKRMEQYKEWIETGKNPPSHMDRYDYSTRSIDPSSKNWASKNWVSQLRKSNRPLNVQQRQFLLWTLDNYNKALEDEQK